MTAPLSRSCRPAHAFEEARRAALPDNSRRVVQRVPHKFGGAERCEGHGSCELIAHPLVRRANHMRRLHHAVLFIVVAVSACGASGSTDGDESSSTSTSSKKSTPSSSRSSSSSTGSQSFGND